MVNKIIDLQEGKHITEMCLVTMVFPDSLAHNIIAFKSIVYK